MPDQMKTTFIPKQTFTPDLPSQGSMNAGRTSASSAVSIITLLATLIFFVTAISFGGVYLFEKNLTLRIAQIKEQLATAEKQFEPSLIEEWRDLDFRLKIADRVLRNHRSVAPLFTILEKNTLKTIEYTNFQFNFREDGHGVVQVKGRARGFEAIAEQAEIFSQERLIREHIFSSFILQDDSRVHFDLTLILSPELTTFESSFPLFTTPAVVSAVGSESV